MAAFVPILVPTITLVKGAMNTSKIINGTERTKFTVVFINKYVIANGKIDDVLTEENIRKTYQNGKYNTDTILL